jgi:hypothetical protein
MFKIIHFYAGGTVISVHRTLANAEKRLAKYRRQFERSSYVGNHSRFPYRIVNATGHEVE